MSGFYISFDSEDGDRQLCAFNDARAVPHVGETVWLSTNERGAEPYRVVRREWHMNARTQTLAVGVLVRAQREAPPPVS